MDISHLTDAQREELLLVIQRKREGLLESFDKLKAEDPFWYYEPSDGKLDEEHTAFLQKWIKPEDIPPSFDSIQDAVRSNAAIILVAGGNQTGKTVLDVILTNIKVTGEVPRSMEGMVPEVKMPKKWPVFGRVYAPSSSMIEEVIVPKFQEWMPKSYWHTQGWERTYNKQEKILRYYKGGSKFVGQVKFLSYEQEVGKTQGASISFAHFDEEPPYEFFKEALPRFTTKGQIDIAFFMTPTNGLTWVKDEIVDKQDGKRIAAFKVPSITNKYANLDVLDQMMQGLDSYEERKMRLLGEFVSLSGLIYKGESEFRPDIHLIQPFELDYGDHLVYRGMDVHLSKPTCVVELAVDPAGNKFVVGVYNEEADTEMVKADLAKRAVDRKYRLGPTRYDKSLDYDIQALGGINIIQKLKLPPNPIPAMFPSEKYKGSIDAGVDEIKLDLKPDVHTKRPKLFFFDTPEVWKLIQDVRTLERDRAQNEEKRGPRDRILEGKKDRHAALRYVYQNRIEWMPADEESTVAYEPESYI